MNTLCCFASLVLAMMLMIRMSLVGVMTLMILVVMKLMAIVLVVVMVANSCWDGADGLEDDAGARSKSRWC